MCNFPSPWPASNIVLCAQTSILVGQIDRLMPGDRERDRCHQLLSTGAPAKQGSSQWLLHIHVHVIYCSQRVLLFCSSRVLLQQSYSSKRVLLHYKIEKLLKLKSAATTAGATIAVESAATTAAKECCYHCGSVVLLLLLQYKVLLQMHLRRESRVLQLRSAATTAGRDNFAASADRGSCSCGIGNSSPKFPF